MGLRIIQFIYILLDSVRYINAYIHRKSVVPERAAPSCRIQRILVSSTKCLVSKTHVKEREDQL